MIDDWLDHPDDQTLRALSLGQLGDSEVERVFAHLSDCRDCCRRIDELDTDDWLLERLRQFAAHEHEMLVSPDKLRAAARALRQSNDGRSAADHQDTSPENDPGSAEQTRVK